MPAGMLVDPPCRGEEPRPDQAEGLQLSLRVAQGTHRLRNEACLLIKDSWLLYFEFFKFYIFSIYADGIGTSVDLSACCS